MKVSSLKIPEVKVIEPEIYSDFRGNFSEEFNQKNFNQLVSQDIFFVQDNYSLSKKNVLRGLHFQIKPFEQAKLIRVVKGAIFDVVVDLREDSDTFGNYISLYLNEIDNKFLWIPDGFAHGFLALEDDTKINYKVSRYYSPEHERTIKWNDNYLDIDWPINIESKLLISIKDKNGLNFTDLFKI